PPAPAGPPAPPPPPPPPPRRDPPPRRPRGDAPPHPPGAGGWGPAAAPPAPAPEPRAPARAEPEPPAAVRLSDDDGAADTAALSRAEPVLTETMAELYLRQGHREDALRVYRALLGRRPGDARLRAVIEALEAG